MASTFFGINRGGTYQNPAKWTVGTSTGSTDIEFRIDQTKALTRMDLMRALDGLKQYFASAGGGAPGLTNQYPPL